MKIEVDVLRAEQSWDLTTRQQQNFLVVSFFGAEIKVPCSPEMLVNAIRELTTGAPAPSAPAKTEVEEDWEDPGEQDVHGGLFVQAEPEPAPPAPARQPAPPAATKETADDAGIGQG
jgi:hypothetical protein